MGAGDFDEDLAEEELVEHVAAKHVEKFACGVAAVEFEALADHMEAVRIGEGQGLAEGEHGVARVKGVKGDFVIVAVTVNVRAGQKEAIAFVDGTEITGHPDLLADRILLGVRTKVAKRAIERAKCCRETETRQQSRARNSRPRKVRKNERENNDGNGQPKKQPVGEWKKMRAPEAELEPQAQVTERDETGGSGEKCGA